MNTELSTLSPKHDATSLGGRVVLLLLQFYKNGISPWLGSRCRFEPSCSMYMYTAVCRYGVVRGVGMGLWRLLRCNPLCKGGYDPVP